MQKRSLLRICLVLAALILFVPGYSSLAQPTENLEDLIQTICKAVQESTADVYSGRGVAKVHFYYDLPQYKPRYVFDPAPPEPRKREVIGREEREEEFLIDFVFKGQSTRADKYTFMEGKRGEFLRSDVDTAAQSLVYRNERGGLVAIIPPHPSIFYRQMGKDFHPETLNQFCKVPFSMHIEGFFKWAKKITPTYTEDGLLCIKREGDVYHADRYSASTLILDPEADYRPIEYRSDSEVDEYGSVRSVRYQAKWKKYGSAWYIERLKYYEEWKSKEEYKKIQPDYKWWVEIEVESFDPTAEVKDSEFTLEGLNIPIGALVTDRIADVIYYYKTPPVDERDLEEMAEGLPVEEPEVTPAAEKEEPALSAEAEAPLAEPEIAVAQTAPPSSKRTIYITIGVAALVLLLGLILVALRRKAAAGRKSKT